ncbi:MAG: type VI secretion system lipoprotein TssJ [Gammaproteobacteria bacterium]|nr:type VI secretion system lipoprotein TssJ [Gammaproteobacteria bacterium]
MKLLGISLMSLWLCSCASGNKSVVGGYLGLDTDVSIEFVVDADSNPDELGIGSPLFVRMYELKNSKMMQKADFIDLYEQDIKTIGADLVGEVHRLKRLKPGENRVEKFVLDKKTQYIALYAEFLEFKDSKYKLIIPVVSNNVFINTAVIRISGNQMLLEQSAN